MSGVQLAIVEVYGAEQPRYYMDSLKKRPLQLESMDKALATFNRLEREQQIWRQNGSSYGGARYDIVIVEGPLPVTKENNVEKHSHPIRLLPQMQRAKAGLGPRLI